MQERLNQAQQHYDTVAADEAQKKAAAEQQMIGADETLRLAREAHASADGRNQQVQAGIDPQTGENFTEDVDVEAQKQQSAEALAHAEAQLHQAEAGLLEATAAFEHAKQQEHDNVAAAQAQLDEARAHLDKVQQGPDPALLAQAQAGVDQARAHLAKLQEDQASAQGAATEAQAKVDEVRAHLAKLQADQAAAQAVVAEAQAEVDKARTHLAVARQAGTGRKGWMWPSFGAITSGFGLRDFHVGRWHNGVDIANSKATPIGAARDGIVIETGWCSGYGYCVKLDHGGGFTSEYGHLDGEPPVQLGQQVSAGTIIGLMGTTL
ncbi:MAG: peptidoglycan DD-metalloendopeptidase family protein [Chloroflexota bacterium]|nr:peptidoglycan DD-metalloendopeptidase family protein [Chloroflexota bacterium]